jgi:hypothetical protein
MCLNFFSFVSTLWLPLSYRTDVTSHIWELPSPAPDPPLSDVPDSKKPFGFKTDSGNGRGLRSDGTVRTGSDEE